MSRLEDLCAGAENRYRTSFLGFLDERQRKLCTDALKYRGVPFRFFGGYEDAERTFLGLSPQEEIPDEEFPLECVCLSFRECDALTHRDILGSLMGLNIKRDTIGDIIVEPGKALVFLTAAVVPVVMGELSKVGRSGVRCSRIPCAEVSVTRKFQELSGTITSLRLDCVVSFLTKASRSEAARLIAAGKVALDGLPSEDPDRQLWEGCRISIRGMGKFIYDGQNGLSKKNRLRVLFRRYI